MLKIETLKALEAAEAILRQKALAVQQSRSNKDNCQYHAGLVRGLLFAAHELKNRRINSRVNSFSESDQKRLEPKPGFGPWRPVFYIGFFQSPMPTSPDDLDWVLHDACADQVAPNAQAEVCSIYRGKITVKKVTFQDIHPKADEPRTGTDMYRVKE